MTVLVLAEIRVAVQIACMVVRIMLVVNHMMFHIESLNIVVVNDMVVCRDMLHVRKIMNHSMLVVRRHVSHLREVWHADLGGSMLLLLMNHWSLTRSSFVCCCRGSLWCSLLWCSLHLVIMSNIRYAILLGASVELSGLVVAKVVEGWLVALIVAVVIRVVG